MIPRTEEKTLDQHEAERNVGQELLDAVDEIRGGGGRRYIVEPKTAAASKAFGVGPCQIIAALGKSGHNRPFFTLKMRFLAMKMPS
jgi:hypothetical protein